MRHLLLILFLSLFILTNAQTDDPEALLKGADSTAKEEVIATFKSTRIVNSQSVQTVGQNVLDFRIMHRFGPVNSGWYQLFGLDNATMRLGFEYGITKDFMIGIGRSTVDKTYDGFLKYKILHQTSGGKRNMPVTLTLFTSTTFKTLRYNPARDAYLPGKIDYVSQILIARKFTERISFQLSPTYVHRNLVETADQKNNLYTIGVGGRFKITHSVAVNFDYFYTSQKQLGTRKSSNNLYIYNNPLSIGIDIETGGHVFQLHYTNSIGLVEKQFIGETRGSWLKGDILFGFNLSRVFTLGEGKNIR